MLRNILRTSRCVARKQVNIMAPAILRRLPRIHVLSTYEITKQRSFSMLTAEPPDQVEPALFEEICNETLESLCDYFEELIDISPNLKGADVTYSDGVLTVVLGPQYGTYVINRQTPNKQIWLSSPQSGPKRYDLIPEHGGYWVYKHDGVTLHKLLQQEISTIVPTKVDFRKCAHSFRI